ncbi:hypothetical protein [Thiothrix nivea]|uniref:Uncharacterized protein n=1 Tax=Thiothrix nivea (strain ATCC 35100 / DSM 5205 / JP2) TaxID=870187 RepID=A0A656HKL0_THINJ|nr:hypothetical protein [Thiothrix nivea]EIJ37027.1 hypothetical protein Thini_0012 [Thiothrix nivea DSM 5205]
MQPNSIPEPVRVEHERTPAEFPAAGNNFVTIMKLEDVPDSLALLEAFAFVQDCEIALEVFRQQRKAEQAAE